MDPSRQHSSAPIPRPHPCKLNRGKRKARKRAEWGEGEGVAARLKKSREKGPKDPGNPPIFPKHSSLKISRSSIVVGVVVAVVLAVVVVVLVVFPPVVSGGVVVALVLALSHVEEEFELRAVYVEREYECERECGGYGSGSELAWGVEGPVVVVSIEIEGR